MRLTRLVASITALCLVTGLIIYGGLFLWPGLAVSEQTRYDFGKQTGFPPYLYSMGDASGPTRPNAVTVAENGTVYVTDGGTAKVYVYSSVGKKILDFGNTGKNAEDFSFPNGIISTRDGNLMIADSIKGDIKLFSPSGKYLRTIVKPSKDLKPGLLSKGPDHLIYVSDLAKHRILVIDENGKTVKTISDPKSPLLYPQATSVDKKGRLWVADSGHYAIKIFDKKGRVVKTIAGGGRPETQFSMVRGIAFDKWGRAFISDTVAHQIRVYDAEGTQLFVSPQQERPEDQLVYPTNLFIDKSGKLFVVDRGAGIVKVFFITK